MLFKTNITFAFRGHAWRFYDINNVNLFKLNLPRPLKLPWQGRKAIFVKLGKGKKLVMRIPCSKCQSYHTFRINKQELLNQKTKVLECPETNFKLCFIGDKDKVLCIAKNHSEEFCLTSREKDKGFFVNPQVMYDVAKKVYALQYDSKLECDCGGQHINIHLYNDRIELVCSRCGGISVVYAENEKDVELIETIDFISIKEKGFRCIDALYSKGY